MRLFCLFLFIHLFCVMATNYFKSYFPGSTFADLVFPMYFQALSILFSCWLLVPPFLIMNWIKYKSLHVLFMSNFPQVCLTQSIVSDLYLQCGKIQSPLFFIILNAQRKQVLASKCPQDKEGSMWTDCFAINSGG